jgi:hypothetical protein
MISNTEKTNYMLMPHHQNAGQNHNIKTDNRSFENVAKFTYMGATATNKNLINEEIKNRLNSGNGLPLSSEPFIFSSVM